MAAKRNGWRVRARRADGASDEIPAVPPLTLIINFALIRSYPALGTMAHFGRSFLLSLILPALQLALLIFAAMASW